jgi:hypothetical protein
MTNEVGGIHDRGSLRKPYGYLAPNKDERRSKIGLGILMPCPKEEEWNKPNQDRGKIEGGKKREGTGERETTEDSEVAIGTSTFWRESCFWKASETF